MRNKTKFYTTFPQPLLSSRAQLHSHIFYLLSPSDAVGQGMGAVVSSSHVSATPSSSGQGLLTLCPCSRVGSLHKLLHWSASHGLQFFTNCSSVGPLRGQKPCQQTCSSVGSCPHMSTGPARSLLQHRLPTGSQPPSGIHLLQHGILPGLQVEICSTTDCRGTACLTMAFITGCRGISALAPGAPPPFPS